MSFGVDLSDKFFSWFLVLLQFLSVAVIIVAGGISDIRLIWLPLIIAVLIGSWAIIIKRFSVSINPLPTDGMKLVTKGPYKLVRHPMYSALLLGAACFIYDEKVSVVALIAWLFLLVVLLYKINFEEQKLAKTFPNYKTYKNKTWRLIPWIY